MMRCVLLVILAVGFCHAQRDVFSDQDGFVFPGEADRPSKFPLNPTNRPTNPTRPFTTSSQRTTQTPTGNPVTPNMNDYNQCINNCRTTSEYNPVCGTDNVVYSNPGRLSCAVACGNNIAIKGYGQCSGTMRG
ncbi:hypothetical protein TSAR_011786 [Trichomalopsis sarcophagae]|uniref:Kazal-like domain-containing protein n=1 Tax=Trichomalopsis sarcophagae TaxID=543379 RepID=A0A232F6N0_9HYME|nr:hypothetical protein TSAR_011786 [Trichomalopsis sarcophagae]